MRVLIGSLNKAEIKGVKKAFSKYFDNIEIIPVNVDPEVSPQPLSLEEIIIGSKTRALETSEKLRDGNLV